MQNHCPRRHKVERGRRRCKIIASAEQARRSEAAANAEPTVLVDEEGFLHNFYFATTFSEGHGLCQCGVANARIVIRVSTRRRQGIATSFVGSALAKPVAPGLSSPPSSLLGGAVILHYRATPSPHTLLPLPAAHRLDRKDTAFGGRERKKERD